MDYTAHVCVVDVCMLTEKHFIVEPKGKIKGCFCPHWIADGDKSPWQQSESNINREDKSNHRPINISEPFHEPQQ